MTSQVKSFAYGLEGLESVSLIVDDSLSVWPGHADNLFPVERCFAGAKADLQVHARLKTTPSLKTTPARLIDF